MLKARTGVFLAKPRADLEINNRQADDSVREYRSAQPPGQERRSMHDLALLLARDLSDNRLKLFLVPPRVGG
jgi:hypothetical protein